MQLRWAACFTSLLSTILWVVPGRAASPTTDRFTAAQRNYWLFQPVARPPVPDVDGLPRPANSIDAFVEARLAEKNLQLAPAADKTTLIRRAYFDLIGIPPTPEQVGAFVDDRSPDAFSKVVEDLLASPHYGERWGRHWLDLARYAESEGFKSDETRPNAWRYRDYVIAAFNADKPYDRFVMEQIAGDELWPDDPQALIATGFNRHFPDETNSQVLMQRRQEILQDITDVVGATFMGLTYGCAKCHDHKFDPILQADYYRLQAFFANTAADDNVVLLQGEPLAEYNRRLAEWQEKTSDIRARISAMIEPHRKEILEDRLTRYPPELQAWLKTPPQQQTPFERQMYHKYLWQMEFVASDEDVADTFKGEEKERYQALKAELDQFAGLYPGELPKGSAMKDLGREAPATHVLAVSNWQAPQQEVPPGFLSILDPGPAQYAAPPGVASTGRRTALAKWLVDPKNPLTARVMVNRIWQHHFGQGIVATPSDFGNMGERPTHPALLDWLADEFVRGGWSIKQMHRLMMNSRTYQQGSAFRATADKADPFNRLLWRFTPQRLEAEVIRDSALAVAGILDLDVGGKSVFPPLPEGMPSKAGSWDVSENAADQNRRSVYIFVRRNARYPLLDVMDLPDTTESCPRREVTTTAPQALMYINSPQTLDWSRAFAAKVLSTAGTEPGAEIEQAFRLAYSRPPDGWEKDASLTFFERQKKIVAGRLAAGEPIALPVETPEGLDPAAGAALVDLCHTILNSNEFVYRF
jgi:Protein of unknown function (DUF1553)/Protein of unknown function (DUF1549)